MKYIDTHELQHSTIQSVYSEWEEIEIDPPYQRNGDVWSLEKKQLLIDSILNRYDIPKIYFHKFARDHYRKTGKSYAVIDGRQRLETIMQFINNEFALASDFVYLEDEKVNPANMNYGELAKEYPKLKSRFDSFSLPIITVETNDLELIEDMFSRLNEAVPLNAAEKRRAIGGDLVKAVDDLTTHPFFTKKIRFNNKRYQHKEAAIRLLFLAHGLREESIKDTKKPFLDSFALEFKKGKLKTVVSLKAEIEEILDDLSKVFTNKDNLLAAQSNVPIYVFVYRSLKLANQHKVFTRSRLEQFNTARAENRLLAEADISEAKFDLIEFDHLSQQGTNDASSIRERWKILKTWLLSQGVVNTE